MEEPIAAALVSPLPPISRKMRANIGESRAGLGERWRMQKTSGGKIRKKVTGESLSSYYEEQKGGKKVEIGGKKGGYREQGMGSVGDAKEGATRGWVALPSPPVPLSRRRRWKKGKELLLPSEGNGRNEGMERRRRNG